MSVHLTYDPENGDVVRHMSKNQAENYRLIEKDKGHRVIVYEAMCEHDWQVIQGTGETLFLDMYFCGKCKALIADLKKQ
jgi:hypothetical protein